MKLIPFNLDAAKAGKPIVCRDGTPAKFVVFTDMGTSSQQVVSAIRGQINAHWITGEHGACKGSGKTNPKDLFMAPERKTVWVNVYQDHAQPCGVRAGILHATRKSADATEDERTKIACLEITYTEGEGL